jgi:hypothetical protein
MPTGTSHLTRDLRAGAGFVLAAGGGNRQRWSVRAHRSVAVGAAEGNVDALILLRIRLPRALMAVIVGGALAARAPCCRHCCATRCRAASARRIRRRGVRRRRRSSSAAPPHHPGRARADRLVAGALLTMLIVYRLGTVRTAAAVHVPARRRRLQRVAAPDHGAEHARRLLPGAASSSG